MQTMTVEEAQSHLAEIIDKLPPGEQVVLTRDNRPVARLIGEKKPPRPGPGLGQGIMTIVADDDEHLEGLRRVHAVNLLDRPAAARPGPAPN